MRDPERIPVLLAAIEEYWTRNPDLRLGQLIVGVSGRFDPFFLEDEELLKRLEDAL